MIYINILIVKKLGDKMSKEKCRDILDLNKIDLATYCIQHRKIAQNVWEFIDYVNNVGEESITDYLVWQWKKLNAQFNYINVVKHSKQYEHKTSGADFELELWMLLQNKSFSFVFQAKKLLREYNSYRSKFTQ